MKPKMEFVLEINPGNQVERKVTLNKIKELRKELELVCRSQFADIWLWSNDDTAMAILRNNDRSMLTYISNYSNDQFASICHDPLLINSKEVMIEFLLGNGQLDEYSLYLTIPTNEALLALEYFFNNGEKPPWLAWEDYSEGE